MRLCRAVPPTLLLLLLLGLARATTPVPDGSTPGPDGSPLGLAGSVPPSPPGRWAVSYGDAVAAVLERLNTRAVAPYVLRLRDAQPQPRWTGDLRHRQELSFTLEETSCRAPGTATADCRTRWLGVLRWCHGSVFLEDQQPTFELSCDTVPPAVRRGRPSRLSDLLARIKLQLRGLGQGGRIWIRDRLVLPKSPTLSG
ncbi:cathelicidin-B1-like [Pterocles gutturalis]